MSFIPDGISQNKLALAAAVAAYNIAWFAVKVQFSSFYAAASDPDIMQRFHSTERNEDEKKGKRKRAFLLYPPMPFFSLRTVFGHAAHAQVSDRKRGVGQVQLDRIRMAEAQDGVDRVIMLRDFYLTRRLQLHHPEDIQHVLTGSSSYNYGKDYGRQFLEPLLGKLGLVTLRDEKTHAIHRKVINPAFAFSALRRIADNTMAKHVVGFLGQLQKESAESNNDPITLNHLFDAAALRIISEAAFKTDMPELEQLLKNITGSFGFSIFFLLPPAVFVKLPLPGLIKLKQERAKLAAVLEKVVENIRSAKVNENAASRSSNGDNKALIDYIAFAKELSQESLVDHCVTFVFAGHDTSSTSLHWLSYLLAKHPNVQETLFEELSSTIALGAVPDDITQINSLPYLNAVIKESMRHIPVVGGFSRTTLEDDVLPSGIFVPKGTTMFVNGFGAHQSRRNWGEDAEEFRPERWLSDDSMHETSTRVPEDDPLFSGKYIPFGAGRFGCIGKEFAMMEVQLVLAVLVRNFDLVWPEGQETPRRSSQLLVRPAKPIKVLVKPRRA